MSDMTPERKLIEAVLDARGQSPFVDHILTTPSVQTALAEVRGQGVASLANHIVLQSAIQPFVCHVEAARDAFPNDPVSAGSVCRNSVSFSDFERLHSVFTATPKPSLVLRWEGDKLWLGGVEVGAIYKAKTGGWDWSAHMHSDFFGWERTEELAQAATEETVMDLVKRAGVV